MGIMHSPAMNMEMVWACVKNGSYSACKASTDLDHRGTTEKEASKNNLEEMRSASMGWKSAVRSVQDRTAWKGPFRVPMCHQER